jgi:nitroreductase
VDAPVRSGETGATAQEKTPQMYESTTAATDSVFEAMFTQRAIRRFRQEPVPEELILKVVEAATKAPNGNNRQPWGWIVVQDEEKKKAIAEVMRQRVGPETRLGSYFRRPPEDASKKRMLDGALNMAENLERVPALVIPCLYPADQPLSFQTGSTIYLAVQNFMLAARAVGLGTVFTAFQAAMEPELRALLNIPEDAFPVALIPLGFPEGKFGPTRRRPPEEVTHWDGWGNHHERKA